MTEETFDPVHRKVVELLPWHVNGSLTGKELARVERHLEECPACRRELDRCRTEAVAVQAQGEPAPAPHPAKLERLLGRLGESPSTGSGAERTERRETPTMGSLLASTPRPVRWLLAAQLAVLVALGAGLAWRGGEPTATEPGFETLSEAGPEADGEAALRIVFAPDTPEREIREILTEVGAEIVAGPTALGVYTLAIDRQAEGEEPVEVVIAHLRTSDHVRFVEPVISAAAREARGRP